MSEQRFARPCCGFLTLHEAARGSYELCPVCHWQDDGMRFSDPDYEGGANAESLNRARANCRMLGASSPEATGYVRPPLHEERPVSNRLVMLRNVLNNWQNHDLDDSIYVPSGSALSLDVPVSVLPFDPERKRVFEEQRYLLGIEQVRDVVEGLEQQLGRIATPAERLRAVVHFARHDAFIDPRHALGGDE